MFDRRGTISRFGSDRPIMVGTRDGVVVGNEAIVTDDELCLVDVGSELPGGASGCSPRWLSLSAIQWVTAFGA
jgi:hypothetical protein